jgi:hypothetical protein
MNPGKFAARLVCSSPIEPELSITNSTSIFWHPGPASVVGLIVLSIDALASTSSSPPVFRDR